MICGVIPIKPSCKTNEIMIFFESFDEFLCKDFSNISLVYFCLILLKKKYKALSTKSDKNFARNSLANSPSNASMWITRIPSTIYKEIILEAFNGWLVVYLNISQSPTSVFFLFFFFRKPTKTLLGVPTPKIASFTFKELEQ